MCKYHPAHPKCRLSLPYLVDAFLNNFSYISGFSFLSFAFCALVGLSKSIFKPFVSSILAIAYVLKKTVPPAPIIRFLSAIACADHVPIGAFVPPEKLKSILDKSCNNTASAKIEAIDVAVNAQPLQFKWVAIGVLNAVKDVHS